MFLRLSSKFTIGIGFTMKVYSTATPNKPRLTLAADVISSSVKPGGGGLDWGNVSKIPLALTIFSSVRKSAVDPWSLPTP